jgi:hypothetical protein
MAFPSLPRPYVLIRANSERFAVISVSLLLIACPAIRISEFDSVAEYGHS